MKFIAIALTAAAATLGAPAHAKSSECPDPAKARADVEQTIRDFFDALRTKENAPFKEVTTESSQKVRHP